MNRNGVFVISLDFELHWGCIEKKPVLNDAAKRYFLNTRNAIPKMLSVFQHSDIHVTWATVGMLFNRNQSEWNKNQPLILPTFENEHVSAYHWIKKNNFSGEEDPFHFAPDLIQKIISTPHQEVGTHTYAHYFCLEPGQTLEQFRADIKMAFEIAKENGIELKSLVFPRNQFNIDYLSVCNEFGIEAVRSCPEIWYWKSSARSGIFKKIFRTGDAYLKFQPIKKVFLKDIDTKNIPLQLPASRLYKPWNPRWKILNKLKMSRIIREMTSAAKSGAYYHLWWHPHNFGSCPEECMNELKKIIEHFNFLKKKYGFQSMNMDELTRLLLQEKTKAL